MATGLFAILDDIAMLLDDTAAMSKLAAKKTAGILGDDLAVNAEKATGFSASRELPVIWAITKGSMLNKLIILPLAFLLSAFAPWAILPILLIGGVYLSYEGTEKVFEWFGGHPSHSVAAVEVTDSQDLVQREATKIKAAVRTDFILSIEIVVIALGTVMTQRLPIQLIVVSFIALLATVGVYGLVALLVRMDDIGLYLIERANAMKGAAAKVASLIGHSLVAALPRLIRLLGVVGTIAMLLVGGGMFVHNIDAIHHLLGALPILVAELLAGLIVGALMLAAMRVINVARAARS